MRFGVISDTHGRLDPKVLKVFAGVDRIFHAGDIGREDGRFHDRFRLKINN